MTDYPMLTLNDDRQMPQLGFGTYKIDDDDAKDAVETAIDVGYQLVDTAAIYENETGVGKGMADGIWLTTKVWNDMQGTEQTKEAIGHSLNRLGRADVDLALIHWPCPDKNKYLDTWKALIDLREDGRVKSIGVSNFMEAQLRELVAETGYAPSVNQIELHPGFQQRALRKVHAELGIVTQSWSPLGQGNGMDESTIKQIADEAGQSAAAVIIRWHIQHGLAVIPKASGRRHIEDNFSALSFTLTDEQMGRIDELDDPEGRIGPNPDSFC